MNKKEIHLKNNFSNVYWAERVSSKHKIIVCLNKCNNREPKKTLSKPFQSKQKQEFAIAKLFTSKLNKLLKMQPLDLVLRNCQSIFKTFQLPGKLFGHPGGCNLSPIFWSTTKLRLHFPFFCHTFKNCFRFVHLHLICVYLGTLGFPSVSFFYLIGISDTIPFLYFSPFTPDRPPTLLPLLPCSIGSTDLPTGLYTYVRTYVLVRSDSCHFLCVCAQRQLI